MKARVKAGFPLHRVTLRAEPFEKVASELRQFVGVVEREGGGDPELEGKLKERRRKFLGVSPVRYAIRCLVAVVGCGRARGRFALKWYHRG